MSLEETNPMGDMPALSFISGSKGTPTNEVDILIESFDMQRKRMESLAPLLCQWFDIVLMDIHKSLPKQEGGILMGCPIWGDAYIDRMIRYSLPTMGTEANLEALRHKAVIVFYGFKRDRPLLWKSTRWLRQLGIHTVWRDIPDEVFAALQTMAEDKYAILAPIQNLLALEAGHNGMGLHMYMIDHCYSDRYFYNLAKLGGKHDAIVQQTCSVDINSAREDIEYWRQSGTNALCIPQKAMGDLMLNHMHRRTARTIMNKLDFPNVFPQSHQATWIGKDAIHMACAPQNIVWLSPQLCLDAPVAFTSTLDMLAPDYIPPGIAHMIQPEDGMAHCELSELKNAPEIGYSNFNQFVYRHWAQVGYTSDYMEYFNQICRIQTSEQPDFLPDEQIKAQHDWIVKGIKAGKVACMEQFFRGQCPRRWPDPEGVERVEQYHEAPNHELYKKVEAEEAENYRALREKEAADD